MQGRAPVKRPQKAQWSLSLVLGRGGGDQFRGACRGIHACRIRGVVAGDAGVRPVDSRGHSRERTRHRSRAPCVAYKLVASHPVGGEARGRVELVPAFGERPVRLARADHHPFRKRRELASGCSKRQGCGSPHPLPVVPSPEGSRAGYLESASLGSAVRTDLAVGPRSSRVSRSASGKTSTPFPS
jgi:hypothetical protein